MMAGEEGVDGGQGGGPGEDVPDWRGGGGGYWRERRTLVKSWYGYGALTEEEETGTPASHTNLLSSKERLKWRSSGALGTLLGRWSRSRNDVMGRPGGSGVQPQPMRKCHTVLALAASPSEPIRPVNRLRNTQQNIVCSRCSSLLSMASSSRYSISTEGNYVQVGGRLQKPQSQPSLEEEEQPLPTLLCKLCLTNVSSPNTWSLHQCGCTFCTQCMSAYVEFEIGQGAYEISCPDAMCQTQGVVTLPEIENLVSSEVVEKHRRFRHNREVERDVRLAWCPSVGCETVCNVSAVEGVKTGGVSNVAVCVHCPTCDLDFCSVCRGRWHGGNHCPTAASLPPVPGISFDSDLIKCCPMCAVPIEKDEGCAQMMCKQCKHVFCWYCLASLDDDFLLRHYDKGPCKNKLGHSRASVIWHRTQVIGIFAGFGILLLVASPLLLLAAPCIVCCKCRVCSDGPKLDSDDDIPEESAS